VEPRGLIAVHLALEFETVLPHVNTKDENSDYLSAALHPTRVRWRILLLLLLITALTFLDRLNLSIAGKYIQDEFHLSTQTMGWVLSAFVLGYALFQVPGGLLGDRFGPHPVITFAIVWWSLLSAATAIAPLLPIARWFGVAWSFSLIRVLIGVGEAAAFPNSNKIVAYWMGTSRRGIGNSIFLAGIGVGGVFAPMFIASTMAKWGWRTSFYICGGIGLAIAILWQKSATSRPQQHRSVNAAELQIIGEQAPGSTAASADRKQYFRLFAKRSAFGLVISNFFVGYASYLYYTWFYLYLVQERHLTVLQGGIWASTPFLAIALLTPIGGAVSDALVKTFGWKSGRRIAVWIGLCLASGLLWFGVRAPGNVTAVVMMALAAGFLGFATTTFWATCIDLAPNMSGSLSGLMNMGGNLGGWISPVLTAYIATHFGWKQALDFAAALPIIAGGFWLMVRADQDLECSLDTAGN
jgi:ACS family glucarate transporter-like MFS transporter